MKIKNLLSVCFLSCLALTTANAAQDYLIGDDRRVYEEKTGWYASLHAGLNFLDWKSTYNSDHVGYEGYDDYTFQSLFGGSLSIGKSFSYFWRGEIEAGYTGKFTDRDEGIEFTFSSPYVLTSAMYDFTNGFYVGASLGAAFPTTTWDWDSFLSGGRSKTSLSPMGGIMLGLSERLDYRFVLDLRYRLAGMYGTKHTRYFEDRATPPNKCYFQSDMGFVLDNQFSVGLRYEF